MHVNSPVLLCSSYSTPPLAPLTDRNKPAVWAATPREAGWIVLFNHGWLGVWIVGYGSHCTVGYGSRHGSWGMDCGEGPWALIVFWLVPIYLYTYVMYRCIAHSHIIYRNIIYVYIIYIYTYYIKIYIYYIYIYSHIKSQVYNIRTKILY
jgi:hypothetical protein